MASVEDSSSELNLDLGLDTLDITNETIDFDEIDELMTTFQHDNRIRDVLEKGVDLREYSRQIETDLRVVEKSSIDDYVKESQNFAYLHEQIRSCDSILETMERLLTGFQADLGNISDEIKYLQDQSSTMSIKLKNRKAVGAKLSAFIDEIIIPPTLVKNICEHEVNDAYLEFLLALNKKIDFVHEKGSRKITAVNDVGPDLERLKMKAVTKIREYLLQQTDAMKRTEPEVIKQVLVKFKYFFVFLNQYAKDVANEVKLNYQDTISKLVLNNFKTYLSGLSKFLIEVGSKNYLLATPEGSLKGFFSDRFSLGGTPDATVFSLGKSSRASIVDDLEAPILVLHEAQAKKKEEKPSYGYEVLFRHYNHGLLTAVTSEHIFQTTFFGSASNIYDSIFSKPATIFLEALQQFLVNSYDSVGILIMIRANDLFRQTMQKRGVTVLNPYFDGIAALLWPRFAAIASLHIESLRTAIPKSLGSIDIRAHYVTRRFAEYLTSLLALNISDKRLTTIVAQLRTQMDQLLQRLANEHQEEKKRVVFMINNIDQILSVLHERAVSGDEVTKIQQKLTDSSRAFCEIEMQTYFKVLIQYVKENNAVLTSQTPDTIPTDMALTEKLVNNFAQNYKQMIDDVNKDVMNFFSNFKTGAQILQDVLSELATVYETFTEIVKKRFRAAPFLRDLLAPNTLTWQIKKYCIKFD